jgi:hypothetical protein
LIELADMVRELRDQLHLAMSGDGSRPIRFELGPVEIEASVMVERAEGAGGKVNFWVVEANADASAVSSRAHRVTVTLQPVLVAPDGSRAKVLIAGDEEGSER